MTAIIARNFILHYRCLIFIWRGMRKIVIFIFSYLCITCVISIASYNVLFYTLGHRASPFLQTFSFYFYYINYLHLFMAGSSLFNYRMELIVFFLMNAIFYLVISFLGIRAYKNKLFGKLFTTAYFLFIVIHAASIVVYYFLLLAIASV